jgi:energy-coupling factor transporter ATP-binding protein EcfA2
LDAGTARTTLIEKNRRYFLKVIAFRIVNFRSIVDSGWVRLSPDQITVFVGQNESGKTSVLEAVARALSTTTIDDDDCRVSASLPEVFLRIEGPYDSVKAKVAESHPVCLDAVRKFLAKAAGVIELRCWWEKSADAKANFIGYVSLDDPSLEQELALAQSAQVLATEKPTDADAEEDDDEAVVATDSDFLMDDLGTLIYEELPKAVLFNEETGRLPDKVDIGLDGVPVGVGSQAAMNFLTVAGIDLKKTLASGLRARETTLNKAQIAISADFVSFWSQTIGRTSQLGLQCQIQIYAAGTGDKAGKPYLVFWIVDGAEQLHPKQRSQGVRWFVSFYLQLRASEKTGVKRLFLLDEPGANLHVKAQADVLKLLNKLSKDIGIIYSTHSPQMLEYPKWYRVHAVQRDGDSHENPTVVIDANKLGAASTDTLTPILTAMGVDLSNQSVIRKQHNVILEEMSGFYYISRFWKLASCTQDAFFIAATGVNKVETMANMFLGWGLSFVVAVDDDNQGRGVVNSLKKNMFGDNDQLAGKVLIKLPAAAIEDVFSTADFKKFVVCDDAAEVESNSNYMKLKALSKPVYAFQFAMKVDSGEISLDSFESETQERIKHIVSTIAERLCS